VAAVLGDHLRQRFDQPRSVPRDHRQHHLVNHPSFSLCPEACSGWGPNASVLPCPLSQPTNSDLCCRKTGHWRRPSSLVSSHSTSQAPQVRRVGSALWCERSTTTIICLGIFLAPRLCWDSLRR